MHRLISNQVFPKPPCPGSNRAAQRGAAQGPKGVQHTPGQVARTDSPNDHKSMSPSGLPNPTGEAPPPRPAVTHETSSDMSARHEPPTPSQAGDPPPAHRSLSKVVIWSLLPRSTGDVMNIELGWAGPSADLQIRERYGKATLVNTNKTKPLVMGGRVPSLPIAGQVPPARSVRGPQEAVHLAVKHHSKPGEGGHHRPAAQTYVHGVGESIKDASGQPKTSTEPILYPCGS